MTRDSTVVASTPVVGAKGRQERERKGTTMEVVEAARDEDLYRDQQRGLADQSPWAAPFPTRQAVRGAEPTLPYTASQRYANNKNDL